MAGRLPAGWEERVSRTTGITYYFNTRDGTCTWARPAPDDDASLGVVQSDRSSIPARQVPASTTGTTQARNKSPNTDSGGAEMEMRSDVPVEHTPFSTPPAPDSRALLDADIKPRALDSMSPTASNSLGNHGTAKNTTTTEIRHATQAERDQGTNGTESADELVFDVRLTRGPTGGIGLVYNRSDPAHGPYRVENMVVGGAAETSKLLWVDDVIHHVEGVSVVDLDVQQVKQLIVGAPGSEVTLGIARPVAHWQRHVAPPDPGADGEAPGQQLESQLFGIGLKFVSKNDEVKVLSVTSGGPADAAGIAAGDTLVAVNDVVIAPLGGGDIASLLVGPANSPVTVTIQHEDQRQTAPAQYQLRRRQALQPSPQKSPALPPAPPEESIRAAREIAVAKGQASFSSSTAWSSSKVARVGTTPTLLDPAKAGEAPVRYLSRALEEQQEIIEHLLYQQQVHVYIVSASERPALYQQQTEALEALKQHNLRLSAYLQQHF